MLYRILSACRPNLPPTLVSRRFPVFQKFLIRLSMNSTIQEEEVCCGNGCNNCILDKFEKRPEKASNPNILSGDYKKFLVKKIQRLQVDIYQFTFKLPKIEDKDNKDFSLIIPPTGYLMMRAPKDHKTVKNSIFHDFQKIEIETEKDLSEKTLRDRHDKTTEDKFISRQFTPFNVQENEWEFDVIFRLEPHGKMTEFIQTLNADQFVEFKGPYSTFSYTANSFENIVIFTQGISITSSLILIQTILENEDDETRITLIPCFKDFDNLLFREQIQEFRRFWNFEATVFLSRENLRLDDKLKYNERIFNGRLNFEEISKILQQKDSDKTMVFYCGRETFKNLIKSALKSLNFTNYNVL